MRSVYNPFFDDLLFPVELDGKWGFYHKLKRHFEIKVQFDEVGFFSEGLARARFGGKWGYVNFQGEWVIPPSYNNVLDFSESVAWVEGSLDYELIHREGDTITKLSKDGIQSTTCFEEGFCVVTSNNGLSGFINIDGQLVSKFEFESCSPYCCGMSLVKMKDSEEWSYRTSTGQLWQPANLSIGATFSEGLAFWNNELLQSGYYDQEGNIVIPPIFEGTDFFSEDVAAVSQDGKYGYINKKGEVIIPTQFDEAYAFINGKAIVVKNKRYLLIDINGDIVLDLGKGWDFIDKYSELPDIVRMVKKGESFYLSRESTDIVFKENRLFWI